MIVKLAFISLFVFSAGCSNLNNKTNFKKYSAEDFFKTFSTGGAAFSFDEKNILVTSDKSGIFNSYKYPVDGSTPTILTKSKKSSVYGLTWMPGDKDLLYLSDTEGDEKYHIYLRNNLGEVKDLTPGKNVRALFKGFSNDFKSFYIKTSKRDPRSMDLYQVNTKTLKQKMVYLNSGGHSISTISSDGKWLVLSKTNNNADSNLYLVNLLEKKPKPQLITKHNGDVNYGAFDFSAENDYLIYGTNKGSEFHEAWKFDLKTKKHTLVYRTNWDVLFVYHSRLGKYRVIGTNENAQTRIKIINLQTGKDVIFSKLPEGSIYNIDFSNSEKLMMFGVKGDRSPGNLFVMNLESRKYKQLSNTLNPEINSDHLVESELVSYPSFDDLQIPSILYKPKSASVENKVPAIVYVHGGPGGQSRKGYSANFQYLTNHGYAILAVNNRGSSGYGKTFNHLDDQRHGDVDLKDCIWGRKYLEGLDWVDGSRVAIMGGSYGGYMTLAALTFAPESFNLGIDIFGVSNWFRTLNEIPPWWESFKKSLYAEIGDPVKDKVRLRKYSPLFHAKNIVRPLLVVQGRNDPRVQVAESDDIVKAARENGTPVEYLLFEDEGHGFTKKVNRIKALNSYHEFLKKHL